MSLLSDVSAEGLKELAGYLKRFPSDDEDADQFWYQLALALRKRRGNTYDYSEQFLVAVGEAEDKAALVFLKDLCRRGIQLDEFVHCLKVINCQQALRYFQPGATTPEISQQGDLRKTLKVGETLELTSEASNAGSLHYAWFHNQRPLPSINSPHLVIRDVTTGHAGTYHCKVTNPSVKSTQLSSALSQPVEVEVTQDNPLIRQETSASPHSPPPVITTQPSSVLVHRQHQIPSTATLLCKAEQSLTYDWYRNGKLYRRNCPNGELVLSKVGVSDAGEYYCVVLNDGGKEISSKATLTFVSDIKLLQGPPLTQTVRVGDKLDLTCTASLGGKLHYEWFRVDKTCREERDVQSLGKVRTLALIVPAEKLTGKGKLYFRCKVSDTTDPDNYVYSHTAEVKVETVWISEEPCDVHAVIKQRAQLTCTGAGSGELRYVWLKSSTRNGGYSVKKTTNVGVLPFDSLHNTDAGYYQCQVENRLQHADSKVVQVKALLPHAMQAARTAPVIKINHEPRACVVADGKSFQLQFDVVCSTEDALNYQWYFNGSKISGATSSVYIRERTSLDDCGPYWCSVRAGGGPACVVSQSARVELQFEEKQPPGSTWQQREGERFFRTKNEERFAREKIALLIGNSRYQHADLSLLRTPEHDVAALQKVLKEMDFKVFSLLDLTHEEMQAALEMFYGLLAPVSGTYALFYFSGHGFSTYNHNNFLVPVDSPPDPSHCFQVDTITRKMQDTFCRAILILDACKVVKEKVQLDDSTTYSSIGNTSNMFELWSCVDSMAASDAIDEWGPHPTSQFNRALIKAINGKERKSSLPEIHAQLLKDLIAWGSAQRPMSTIGMSDSSITLQDSIMMDDQSLESALDKVLRDYNCAHTVPEPVLFQGSAMHDLSQYANLKLSFSLLLTNVLCIDAELHQLHGDKTSSASVEFDREFLGSQGVSCSQEDPHINGREEGLCARASLLVRGLQKLKCPLKLPVKVCLWESGQERSACLTYKFKQPPFIATNPQTVC